MHSSPEHESFLNDLREQTQPIHKALEAIPLSMALLSDTLSLSQYTHYLQAMYPVIRDVEQQVFPIVKSLLPDLPQRMKQHLLEQDLKGLNTEIPTGASPLQDDLPTLTIAQAMGLMYVIEGSTLGGRVILKSLDKNLGLSAENNAAYFSGYGAGTGLLWKAFLEHLTNYAVNENKQQEVIAGAEMGFAAIYEMMKEKSIAVNEV